MCNRRRKEKKKKEKESRAFKKEKRTQKPSQHKRISLMPRAYSEWFYNNYIVLAFISSPSNITHDIFPFGVVLARALLAALTLASARLILVCQAKVETVVGFFDRREESESLARASTKGKTRKKEKK